MIMRFAGIVLLLFCGALSAAELTIEITSGNDNPTSIAVVPFGAPPGLLPPEAIDSIVSADLQRSGLFRLIEPGEYRVLQCILDGREGQGCGITLGGGLFRHTLHNSRKRLRR